MRCSDLDEPIFLSKSETGRASCQRQPEVQSCIPMMGPQCNTKTELEVNQGGQAHGPFIEQPTVLNHLVLSLVSHELRHSLIVTICLCVFSHARHKNRP